MNDGVLVPAMYLNIFCSVTQQALSGRGSLATQNSRSVLRFLSPSFWWNDSNSAWTTMQNKQPTGQLLSHDVRRLRWPEIHCLKFVKLETVVWSEAWGDESVSDLHTEQRQLLFFFYAFMSCFIRSGLSQCCFTVASHLHSRNSWSVCQDIYIYMLLLDRSDLFLAGNVMQETAKPYPSPSLRRPASVSLVWKHTLQHFNYY